MSGLPKGWVSLECGATFEQISSSNIKVKTKDTKPEGKFPVIDQGAQFIAGYVDNEDCVISIERPVCIFGDHTRIVKWVDFNFVPGADGTKILVPKSYLHERFFYYQLRNIEVKDRGYSRHFKYLKEAHFKIAPLNEQIRIADKLDSVLAKVDRAQARLDKIPGILKRFRQSVLAAATSGELTKEWRNTNVLHSKEWARKKLKEVATSIDPNPSHRYPAADSSGVPILSTQQFVGLSDWTTDKAKLVSREFFEERKEKTSFYFDDIIFARKGRLGLARFAPKNMDYVYSHTVFIVRASKLIHAKYLLWFLRDDSVVDWLVKEMNSNTGVPTLGKAVFDRLPISLPSLDEQSEIVRKIDTLFELADEIESQHMAAKYRIDRLYQSILERAFRGTLVPQDPNEESASELLQRIRPNKAGDESAKTTKPKTKVSKVTKPKSVKQTTNKDSEPPAEILVVDLASERHSAIDRLRLTYQNEIKKAHEALVDTIFSLEQFRSITDFKGNYEELKALIMNLLKGIPSISEPLLTIESWNEKSGDYLMRLVKQK